MRLLAPPPTMKPTPPAIASEVSGSSFYIFADVAIAPTAPLDVVREAGPG